MPAENPAATDMPTKIAANEGLYLTVDLQLTDFFWVDVSDDVLLVKSMNRLL